MHILIDVQALQSPNTRNRGIDRYTRNLVHALAQMQNGWRIELVQSGHLPAIDRALLSNLPLTTFHPPCSAEVTNAPINEQYYADWITSRGPDAVLLTSAFDEHVVMPRFIGTRPPLFVVLYDLIPLLFHEQFLAQPKDAAAYGERLRRVLASDGVLAISQSTADDLRSVAGGECPALTVIGGAANDTFSPTGADRLAAYREEFSRRFGIDRDFILYVGGFDFRKNMHGALQAFAALPSDVRREIDFVMACHFAPPHRHQVCKWARELGIADSVKLPGYVSDEALRALYSLCRVFFFPSLYEGFGLPVIEALRCGAPVVASNCSSIPEVAGAASWLVDPNSCADCAAALVAALSEPREKHLNERLRHAETFTWKRTAELAADTISQTSSSTMALTANVNERRLRLAWVSPVPPTISGIADYSAELLEPLSERYDIEVVVGPTELRTSPELCRKFMILGAHEVSARHSAQPFDLFVYQVGNSHHHIYMLDLIRRYRGLVVLHDFYLGGLVLPATLCGAWPVSLADELNCEGETRLAERLRAGVIGPHDAIENVPLNRRLLSQAEAVAVHSVWSWGRVRRLVSVPVARIPQAVPVATLRSRLEERQRLGLPLDRFLIASLGFIGRPKRIPSLLKAVTALPSDILRRTEILLVGHAPPPEEAALRKQVEELNLTSQVRFVGRVNLSDFAAYARAADACVQLRYPTRGETSAALLRELQAGATCIVSDHGSIAELPDDVALKVRTPHHEVADLTTVLQRLYRSPEERHRLGEAAARYASQHHSMRCAVERYAAIIELSAAQREANDARWCEAACDALALRSDGTDADSLIMNWSRMRHHGRRQCGDSSARHRSDISPHARAASG